jgi:hypothetical protein
VRRALSYLSGLRGSGGTMMIEGIKAALDGQTDSGRMRVVAFLTDGYIGNEREILAAVRQRIGDARLFSFGIGSSVNRYLLEGLAEEGRGAAAFRTPRESAEELVDRFVERISAPVLTDIEIAFEDVEAFDIEPAPVPDLFAGQPLVLSGRYQRPGTGVLIVAGKIAGEPVTFRRVLRLPEREPEHEALGRLWARARIHRLERELHGGERKDVVERITNLALRHRLMTRYTSLVAVDSEVVNPGGDSTSVEVPVELPQDVPTSALGNQQVVQGLGYVQAPSAGDARRSKKVQSWHARTGAPVRESQRVAEEPAKDEAEADGARELAFESLRLVESDGSQLLVEADGEVWRIDGPRRSLVTVLRADALSELRRKLRASAPGAWTAARRGGARLVVTTSEGRFTASLDGAGGALEALANHVRRFGRTTQGARGLSEPEHPHPDVHRRRARDALMSDRG